MTCPRRWHRSSARSIWRSRSRISGCSAWPRRPARWFTASGAPGQPCAAEGERIQTAARQLGSERLEAMGLEALATTTLAGGRQREALGLARQAFALCQRGGGLHLSGPSILSAVAEAEGDPNAAGVAVARGEELLAAGCAYHNHFTLREAGIRLALAPGCLGRGPAPCRRAGAASGRRAPHAGNADHRSGPRAGRTGRRSGSARRARAPGPLARPGRSRGFAAAGPVAGPVAPHFHAALTVGRSEV